MATFRITMDERDMAEAIAEWARKRGHQIEGPVMFAATPGDRPGESQTYSASVTAAPIPAPDPQR